MHKFPFSKDEWDEIVDISCDMVNFLEREDEDSPELFTKFLDIINKLENKYGRHPVLLETLADFTDEPKVCKKLYTEALEIAKKHGLPSISIRNTFANLLIEDFQDYSMALQILQAGDKEIKKHDDKYNIEQYFKLKRKLTIKLCN